MIPRKPYRSPFWKPDSSYDQRRDTGARASRGAASGRGVDATLASTNHLGAPERDASGKYSSSDLEQFDRLMKFDGRADVEPGEAAPKPNSVREEIRARSRPEVAAHYELSGSYKKRDVDLFQNIQTEFSKTPSEPVERRSTSAQAGTTDRSPEYSQRDIEAFEKIMKFGPR
jgi:hypothetical protein